MRKIRAILRLRQARLACQALFAALLIAVVLYTLLFSGFTNYTPAAQQRVYRFSGMANYGVFALAFLCLLIEALIDVRRAIFAALLLYLRWHGPLNWQSGMLLDTVLLAALSNLGTQRGNGIAWLASHGVYFALLFLWLRMGWAAESSLLNLKTFWSFKTARSFGMGHPNNFAILLGSTWMMVWALFVPKRWWATWLFSWAGALVIFWLTLCRTVVGLMLVLPLLASVADAVACSRRSSALLGAAAIPALALPFTAVIRAAGRALGYPGGREPFWIRFIELDVVEEGGLKLFGGPPFRAAYFDNLYVWLLSWCGLIPTLGALTLCTWMLICLARRKETALLTVAVLFLAYGLMENAAVYAVYFFVPMLAFAREGEDALFSGRKKLRKKDVSAM